MAVVTIAERKAREVERLLGAGALAIRELRRYAAERDGLRLSIFGSFARGDVIPSSDFDVLVEGPAPLLNPARNNIEAVCDRLGLRADVHLDGEISEGLRLRIARDAIVLP